MSQDRNKKPSSPLLQYSEETIALRWRCSERYSPFIRTGERQWPGFRHSRSAAPGTSRTSPQPSTARLGWRQTLLHAVDNPAAGNRDLLACHGSNCPTITGGRQQKLRVRGGERDQILSCNPARTSSRRAITGGTATVTAGRSLLRPEPFRVRDGDKRRGRGRRDRRCRPESARFPFGPAAHWLCGSAIGSIGQSGRRTRVKSSGV